MLKKLALIIVAITSFLYLPAIQANLYETNIGFVQVDDAKKAGVTDQPEVKKPDRISTKHDIPKSHKSNEDEIDYDKLIFGESKKAELLARSYFKMVPEKIQMEIEDLGYRIIVTSDSDLIAKIAQGASYQNPKAKIISVVVEDYAVIYQSAEDRHMKYLLHEIGHIYSDILDNNGSKWPYEREAFKEAYEKEGENLGGYAAGDICEFYAEAFMYFFVDKELLYEQSPLAYECLQSDLNQYLQ